MDLLFEHGGDIHLQPGLQSMLSVHQKQELALP
jgi:hypothetical protein